MQARIYNYACMSKQLCIRGVPDEVGRRLAGLARSEGISMNAVVLRLLKEAVGVDDRRRDLERFATWTEADLAEFQRALGSLRTVDDRLWR